MGKDGDSAYAFQVWLCSVDNNTLVTEGGCMRCEVCGRLYDGSQLVDEEDEADE